MPTFSRYLGCIIDLLLHIEADLEMLVCTEMKSFPAACLQQHVCYLDSSICSNLKNSGKYRQVLSCILTLRRSSAPSGLLSLPKHAGLTTSLLRYCCVKCGHTYTPLVSTQCLTTLPLMCCFVSHTCVLPAKLIRCAKEKELSD